MGFKKGYTPWNKDKINLYHHSEETKRKMSEVRKGKKLSEEHKEKISKAKTGCVSWNKGKRFSDEHRKNLSESHKNIKLSEKHNLNCQCSFCKAKRKELVGNKNHNWKGGLSFEPYSIEFNNRLKEQIRERDNRLCQFCGIEENGNKQNVHHIDYNKKNCRPINLITVCVGCNTKANADRDKWQMFFEILQEIRGI